MLNIGTVLGKGAHDSHQKRTPASCAGRYQQFFTPAQFSPLFVVARRRMWRDGLRKVNACKALTGCKARHVCECAR